MANLTSTLDIVLKDDVSRSAATIEASLKKLANDAKAADAALGKSGTGEKFQAGLKKLGASAVHVEAVTKAWQDYAKAEQLAGSRGDWTSKQVAQVKNWESVNLAGIRAVMSADKTLQAQQHARAEAQRRDAERVAHVQQHQAAHHGFGNYVAQSALMAVSAHGVLRGIEKAAEAGADLQNTRLSLRNAGVQPLEAAEMERHAMELSRRFGNVGQTAIMDLSKEARSVLKDSAEVSSTTSVLAAAKSVLDAQDKTGGSSSGLGMLVKGAESIGAAQDPERLKGLIDSYVKAIQVMGHTISPEQIYEFDKYAKTAGARFSDRFLMTTGLSLAQEMGGSTAGNDIAQVSKAIIGGFANKHVPLKEMVRVGMIDKDDVELTKTGDAKGIKAGHKGVRGADLAASDLDLWVYNELVPHLEKAGMKSQTDQLNWVTKVFTGTQADVISKLITQRASFEYHAGMYPKASGLAGAENNRESATTGLTAFNTALTNLLGNATSSAMEPAGRGLYMAADALNALSEAAAAHPELASAASMVTGAGALYGAGRASMAVLNGLGSSVAKGIASEIAGSGIGGAVSRAIVGEVAGVVEGGLTVGALEVAATGALAMSVGTVALTAAAAVLTIGALRSSMDPKHRASDDPGFADPFAPGKKGVDPNDPNLPRDPSSMSDDEKKEAAKSWWNQNKGAHPRGGGQSQRDTDLPGHWAYGRAGTAPHWVLEDQRPMKNAPYFATAPLGPDGHPLGYMPNGWNTGKGPVDPTTGSRIGWGHLPTDPALYEPADVPVPISRPASQLESRTFGNYLRFARPLAAAGEMGDATPAQHVPDIAPNVDTSGVDSLKAKTGEAHSALEQLNMSVAPSVSMAALDALIAKAREARNEMESLGSVASGGNARVMIGARRSFQATPAGAISV